MGRSMYCKLLQLGQLGVQAQAGQHWKLKDHQCPKLNDQALQLSNNIVYLIT